MKDDVMGNTIKTFKISYVFLPVLIGLVVVSWLFYRDFNPELFSGLHFSWRMCGGILLAFLFIFGRDFGAMARMGHTPREYFEAFGSDIVHIHFVDGNPTGHLAWGDGSRDLKTDLAVLEEYGYQGYLSLETATQRYYEKPWSAEMKTLKSFEE